MSDLLWNGKGARISLYKVSRKVYRYRVYVEGRKRPMEFSPSQFQHLEKAFRYYGAYSGVGVKK